MTSVPTWLAVLVPIAAALVSGSAGIVGALLGGRAATRTAERNAAIAREDEQRRWNRARREKAYVELLDRRNHLIELKHLWEPRLKARRPEAASSGFGYMTDTEQEVFAAEETDAEGTLGKALAAVELVGTEAAVKLSRQWVDVLYGAHLRRERGLPIPTWRGTMKEFFEYEETTFRDPFVALIREELYAEIPGLSDNLDEPVVEFGTW